MPEEILSSVSEVMDQRVVPEEEARQNNRGDTWSVHIADEPEMPNEGDTTNCMRMRNKWLKKIIEDAADTSTVKKLQMRPRIQRVLGRLQEVKAYKKCFEPVLASIGPYHHGKPEFEAMEKLKVESAREFVLGSNQKIDVFYGKVLAVVDTARECYADDSTGEFDDEAFTRIMFLDGCFVLHVIDSFMHDKQNELTTNSYNAAFLLRDLFLLENQLPYLVLQELMELRFQGDEGKDMINQFINLQVSTPGCLKPSSSTIIGHQKPLHLLDLLRIKLVEDYLPSTSDKSTFSNWQSFRSVKELRAVGINFKRSQRCCLKDIRFKSNKIYGELSLPPIVVDDSTKPKFLNLMAYELCPDSSSHDYSVTSYICFLDSLIDSADDVKELRSKGILLNFLGSDDQVADLFNQLAVEMVPDPRAYYEVKGGIELHYKNRLKVSLVEFLTTHFRSPWTAFAFLAATLVIILTLIQTVFTVFPRS